MKTLVFNLLVVGALAFMLFDGDPPTSVSAAVQKVAVKTEQLVEKGKALMGEPTVRPRVIPTSSPKPTPEPVGAPVVDKIPEPKVVATTTPAPAAPVRANRQGGRRAGARAQPPSRPPPRRGARRDDRRRHPGTARHARLHGTPRPPQRTQQTRRGHGTHVRRKSDMVIPWPRPQPVGPDRRSSMD